MSIKLEPDLFAQNTKKIGGHSFEQFSLGHKCELLYCENYLNQLDAQNLFDHLLESIRWQQNQIKVFGKTYDEPRLVSWFGPMAYTYSNLTLKAQKLPSVLEGEMNKINRILALELNSVLCNFYRNGTDSVGWHADNEPEMHGDIVSLSLG